jgi:RNA polymerase sigma-70 factor (ECF subfamily)
MTTIALPCPTANPREAPPWARTRGVVQFVEAPDTKPTRLRLAWRRMVETARIPGRGLSLWSGPWLVALGVLASAALAAASDGTRALKYGDGQADGKQSLGGSGELIEFSLPPGASKVTGVRIHGSRYGTPDVPDESFLIYFLAADRSRVVATEMARYALFERGPERWVTVTFDRPVEVPERFWVALDFRAHQRKGVYVSYDTSTGGRHSRTGLPGTAAVETKFGGDWMVEVILPE